MLLPINIKKCSCSTVIIKDAKCQVIYNLLASEDGPIKNFSEELQRYKQIAKEYARELLKEEIQEKDREIKNLKEQLAQAEEQLQHI